MTKEIGAQIKTEQKISFLYDIDFDAMILNSKDSENEKSLFTLDELNFALDLERLRLSEGSFNTINEENNKANYNAANDIASSLSDARTQMLRLTNVVLESLSETILAMVSAFLPSHCSSQAEKEVYAVISALAPAFKAHLTASIQVHPSLVPAISDALTGLDTDLKKEISVTASSLSERGDVKVVWSKGEAIRSVHEVESCVKQALHGLGLGGETFETNPSLPSAGNPLISHKRNLSLAHTD